MSEIIKVSVQEEPFAKVSFIEEPIARVNIVGEFFDYPISPYEGPYEVTPSSNEQILSTQGKQLGRNIVIHKIPSNYGLVTYSGFELTVS